MQYILLRQQEDFSDKQHTRQKGRFPAQGLLPKDATVVSVVTGNGLKDVANTIAACGEPISIPSDMDLLLKAFAEKGIEVEQ